MKQLIHRHHPLPPWQSFLLIGLIIAITSQFYLLVLADNSIRISAAVILYPILLLTLVEDGDTLQVGCVTTAIVLVLRTALQLGQNPPLLTALLTVLAGGCYYLIYAVLFFVARRLGFHSHLQQIVPALLLCDLIANLGELALTALMGRGTTLTVALLYSLLGVALLRTAITAVLLWWLGYYRRLLIEAEHEARYQRLFLMAAQLKNESYLLEKSTDQIEQIMSNAYRLYEQLSQERHPSTELALSITRDIHEVKKDGQRVLRGLETGLDEIYDQSAISYTDLLHILLETGKSLYPDGSITFTHQTAQNFSTAHHHQLASILRNLMNNAAEAIQSNQDSGNIHIDQWAEGDGFHFTVTDDGPGISSRGIQNIFQMGYSTKFNPVTGDMNRGVGLSTVQSLTQALEGSISVNSEIGKGTCFTLIIPKSILEN